MTENTPERLREFRAQNASGQRSRSGLLLLNTALLLIVAALLAFVAYRLSAVSNSGAGDIHPEGGLTADALRRYAAYLEEKKLPEAAVAAYGQYLDRADLDPEARARVCYSVAKLAIDAGQYETALTYLYQSEMLAPDSDLKDDVDKRIVFCLERLGRSVDLRRELRKRTQPVRTAADLEPGETILAEFAGQIVSDRDLDLEIEKLPVAARDSLGSPERKADLLKNMVAERLLLDRAFRLELDKDPEVQEQLNAMRDGLIVRKLIDREVRDKLQVTPEDIERFYKAESALFTEPRTRVGLVGEGDSPEAARAALPATQGDAAARRVVLRGDALVRGLGVPDSDETVAAALRAAVPGQIADPLEIGGRWFAFAVSETPERVRPFDEARSDAERMLRARKEQEQFRALIEDTLRARDVVLHLDRLAPEARNP